MANAEKSAVKIIFGAMTFGHGGRAILDVFQAHGHNEVDTARFYADGTSEVRALSHPTSPMGIWKIFFISNRELSGLVFVAETSASIWSLCVLYLIEMPRRTQLARTRPHYGHEVFFATGKYNAEKLQAPEGGWYLTPEGLRANLMISLEALKTGKIEMWYLHGPACTVPLEDTMKGVNDLYKEGYSKRLGVSNFMAWEVAKMCEICKENGYVIPSVYQGIYNALHRAVEPELFPCLRYYGMAFYNFNPLAGGYLISRYHREMTEESVERGSRFDPKGMQGRAYRARYWSNAYSDALDILRPAAKKYGLTEAACALRWMTHHSLPKREFGDGTIIGASNIKQISENMEVLDDPEPLPQEVLDALDAGWTKVKSVSWKYWH